MEPHIAQKSPYASPVEAGKASRSPFSIARTEAAHSRPWNTAPKRPRRWLLWLQAQRRQAFMCCGPQGAGI